MAFDYSAHLKSKNYRKIYEHLLNYVKDNKQGLKLKKEIDTLKNNCKGNNKTFREIINFKDDDDNGNTLLHNAVMDNNHEAAKILLEYDTTNPLIKNTDGKIPLDLAKGETRKVLVRSMKDQASLYKGNARDNAKWVVGCSAVLAIIVGVLSHTKVECASNGCRLSLSSLSSANAKILYITVASIFAVGMAIGIAIKVHKHFFNQDYKQAKAIEKALPQENKIDSVTHADGIKIT